MKVFLDASALVPLAIERDQWFFQLRRHLRVIRQAGSPHFVATNWTYFEALSITRRASYHTVTKLKRIVDAEVEVVGVDSVIEAEALRRFFAWRDKTASVIDHANLLMAVRLSCDAILSFDDDFVPIAAGSGVHLLH